jgi:hypothetical protein
MDAGHERRLVSSPGPSERIPRKGSAATRPPGGGCRRPDGLGGRCGYGGGCGVRGLGVRLVFCRSHPAPPVPPLPGCRSHRPRNARRPAAVVRDSTPLGSSVKLR